MVCNLEHLQGLQQMHDQLEHQASPLKGHFVAHHDTTLAGR